MPYSWGTFGANDSGGFRIRLTNKTGANSVKGTLVESSTAFSNAFMITSAGDFMPIGVVDEDGIPDGQECWIVIGGIAEGILEDGTASTVGNLVVVSANAAGRIDATINNPGATPTLTHFREVGHCLETKVAGVGVKCKFVMHFN